MTNETFDNIIVYIGIAVLAYTLGYFIGGGV